jgi:tyrosyl-tRNA synthetase
MTFQPKSDFLHTLETRGFLADCTDLEGLDTALCAGPVAAYIGYDLTASSLHIGNLVQIMTLRWLQKTGHKPITLMGGGTTKVGDPSGKDEMRRILSVADIDANAATIRTVFDRYLSYGDGPGDALMPNNADWLDGLRYIDFLRDIGRHFTINRMLAFESVKSRLDRAQALSFIEFNYMLLQAYDFLELYRRYGVILQMGGSDQWGNIVSGADLIRRVEGAEAYGLTTPLVTRSDGKKMGKTADGAVWLNPDRMAPYAFWQFWRNVDDADVGRFLKMFTELPLAECDRLGALGGSRRSTTPRSCWPARSRRSCMAPMRRRPPRRPRAKPSRRAGRAPIFPRSILPQQRPLQASPPPSFSSAQGWRNRARRRNG